MSPSVWGQFPSSFPGVRHRFIDFSACRSIEDFNRTVYEAVSSVDGPDVVIAWSMGAMLAIEALQQLPVTEHNVRRLVIFGGTLKFVDRDRSVGCPRRVLDAMIRSLENDPREPLSSFRASVFGEHKPVTQAEATDFSPEGLANGLLYLRDADLRECWLKFKADTDSPEILWIHGATDGICPPGCVPEQAVIVPDAGHAPFADSPKACLSLMETFIFDDDDYEDE